MDYLEPDLFDQVMAELQRERAVRRQLYPDRTRTGQMSMDIANHRLKMLELVGEIEAGIRAQLQEHVSPQLGVFLSQKLQEQLPDTSAP